MSACAAAPSPVAVTIAPMRRRHLRSVLRIEAKGEHKGWSLGLYMSELSRRDDRVYLVAKVGSSVVGFAGLLFAGPDGHVTTIAVDPAWRQHRIATRMMLVLARKAVERGAEALTLEVATSNLAGQALYRRLGFAPAGVRKNYYAEMGEDALVMWAHDVQAADYSERLTAVEAGIEGVTTIEAVGW